MRVLVTGAEGFIGSHLIRRLADEGARVFALVHPLASLSRLSGVMDRIECRPADITDSVSLEKVIGESRPRRIFHLAAVTDVGRDWENLSEALRVNLQGAMNLLRKLRAVDYEVVITTCTAEAYGRNPAPFREEMALDPVSPYSFSKAAATAFCRMAATSLGASTRVLRLFLVYGPGQGEERFLPQLIRAGLEGRPFRMTPGEQTREYTYIDDVVEGFVRAAGAGPGKGEVFNLGSGREISLRDLVSKVGELLGREIILDPEKLPYRENEIWRFVGDHSRARSELGWEPAVGLEEGLGKTIGWYRSRFQEG